jgi:hypothetical protein
MYLRLSAMSNELISSRVANRVWLRVSIASESMQCLSAAAAHLPKSSVTVLSVDLQLEPDSGPATSFAVYKRELRVRDPFSQIDRTGLNKKLEEVHITVRQRKQGLGNIGCMGWGMAPSHHGGQTMFGTTTGTFQHRARRAIETCRISLGLSAAAQRQKKSLSAHICIVQPRTTHATLPKAHSRL